MASELLKNQLNSKPTEDAINSDNKPEKVNKILERAIEKAENSPNCSPEQIWEEFEAVWDKISSQSQP